MTPNMVWLLTCLPITFKTANFYAENLEFGMVGINEWAAHGTELPFVGIKSSGIGHESGSEGLKEYLELKLISYGNMSNTILDRFLKPVRYKYIKL